MFMIVFLASLGTRLSWKFDCWTTRHNDAWWNMPSGTVVYGMRCAAHRPLHIESHHDEAMSGNPRSSRRREPTAYRALLNPRVPSVWLNVVASPCRANMGDPADHGIFKHPPLGIADEKPPSDAAEISQG